MSTSWDGVERALAARETIDLSWLEPLPPPQTWPLDGESLRFLAALVGALEPTVVVEFGSGYSTRVLAWAAGRTARPGRVVAIENDPLFAQRVREHLSDDGVGDRATVLDSPLVVRHWDGAALPAYLIDGVALDEPAALVLIDGPSQLLGGRAGTLFQAVELARAGTVVLLDDADRAGEADLLEEWSRSFENAIEVRPLEGLPNLVAMVLTEIPVPAKGHWWLDEPRGWGSRRDPADVRAGGGR